ncbi:MAG: hypothetical protein M3275_14360 [Thermoproteota archaeon]|nr:hypothetical protein [Thermoproteota archaeon]
MVIHFNYAFTRNQHHHTESIYTDLKFASNGTDIPKMNNNNSKKKKKEAS